MTYLAQNPNQDKIKTPSPRGRPRVSLDKERRQPKAAINSPRAATSIWEVPADVNTRRAS